MWWLIQFIYKGERKMINKVDLNPKYNFTFSTFVQAGDFIFVSHHGGYHKGEFTTIEEQTELCFKRLRFTLEKAGAALEDIVHVNVYLKDPKYFKGFRDVFRMQFKNGYPARMGIFSNKFLDEECLMQMDAIAYKPENNDEK